MKTILKGLVFFTLIIAVAIVVYKLIFCASQSSYMVNARTEKVEFVCFDENMSNYILYDAKISSFDTLMCSNFSGTATLSEGTRVTFERPSFSDLIITFQNNKIQPAVKFYDNENNFKFQNRIKDYVEIQVPLSKENISKYGGAYFAIDGDAKIGNNIDRANWGDPVALILDGHLSIIGRSFIGNHYFESEKILLYAGDLVSFNEEAFISPQTDSLDTKKIIQKGQGFVKVDTDPGMLVNYRRNANYAIVYKTGLKTQDSSYTFNTSIVDKMILDKSFRGFAILVALFSILGAIGTFYFDFQGYLNNK